CCPENPRGLSPHYPAGKRGLGSPGGGYRRKSISQAKNPEIRKYWLNKLNGYFTKNAKQRPVSFSQSLNDFDRNWPFRPEKACDCFRARRSWTRQRKLLSLSAAGPPSRPSGKS